MANMSYCRFRNTLQDLRDCVEALRDIDNGSEELPSQDELDAMADMESQCRRFLERYESFSVQLRDD